ncbi:MAG TPA: trypsin-like peptidase domain-containing protein, partial [Patescibacteria group bacterium]|nr:trypsin-like peptidase domain-containing protein [Patescibacteria group bacterium]
QKKTYEVQESSSVIEVAEKSSPSVVSIVVTKELENYFNITGPDVFDFWNYGLTVPENRGKTQKRQVGGGTGFVVGADGLILTNKHVVADSEADYSVVFNNGDKYEARVLARDTVSDIAILKIEAEDLSVLPLGDSDNLKPGQTAVAIGNALSEYQNTVTRGVISGVNRHITAGGQSGSSVIEGAIQTDAAINPGNSGGPLLNIDGQVIGINTAVNWQGQSIGFAIPINQAKAAIESVKTHGEIIRPWLGVRYVQLTADIAEQNNLEYDYGALIVRGQSQAELAIVPGSPADKAGLEENDIILEVNNEKITKDNSLVRAVSQFKPGDKIELTVFHDGEIKKIIAELAKRQN